MSDPWGPPWSNNPNAPAVSEWVYLGEKADFAGDVVMAIFYGIVVILFFQCMDALFCPSNRVRVGVKWGLAVHTVTMFSFVTAFTVAFLHVEPTAYLDNREFPGIDNVLPPGPFGYLYSMRSITNRIPAFMFVLNQWLADGLLLYRCSVIYSMNYWVMAFPCMIYLATFAMGVAWIYVVFMMSDVLSWEIFSQNINYSYFSISFALNIVLTLMIVTRLAWYSRNIQKAMGAPTTVTGLYKRIITMLVESFSIYAINYLIFIALYGANHPVVNTFSPILAETQVIAPFLIILRVVNRRALTKEAIATGSIGSICFKPQGESTGDNTTVAEGVYTSFTEIDGETPGDRVIEIGVQPTEFHNDI